MQRTITVTNKNVREISGLDMPDRAPITTNV